MIAQDNPVSILGNPQKTLILAVAGRFISSTVPDRPKPIFDRYGCISFVYTLSDAELYDEVGGNRLQTTVQQRWSV